MAGYDPMVAASPREAVLATNKVIRNTYTLLSMTLVFSALMAGLSMQLAMPPMAYMISLVGAIALNQPVAVLAGLAPLVIVVLAPWALLRIYALQRRMAWRGRVYSLREGRLDVELDPAAPTTQPSDSAWAALPAAESFGKVRAREPREAPAISSKLATPATSAADVPTRDRILEVAEEIISRSGMEGMRLKDVAARVGIQPPSIFAHFEGREAIGNAVAARVLDQLAALVTRDCMIGVTLPKTP